MHPKSQILLAVHILWKTLAKRSQNIVQNKNSMLIWICENSIYAIVNVVPFLLKIYVSLMKPAFDNALSVL